MLRKLMISTTLVATTASLALASTASAMLQTEPSYGSPAATSGSSGFAWGELALGIGAALAVAACCAVAVYVVRSRRVAALNA